MSEPLSISMDDEAQVATIEGVRYSYDLFREWGAKGMQVGQHFKVMSRQDGCFTIQKIQEPSHA